ncbi:MAG: hypothetical protein ACOVNU_11270 [Candidatus Kapaibacteriota bacterium]|jgi:hypothetical protein
MLSVIKISYKLFTFFVLLVLLMTYETKSQVQSRTLQDSILNADGYWYYPHNYQYQYVYPKLTVLPPINSGMDFETLLTYIVLDSAMRNINKKLLYKNYLKYWEINNIKNDTTINIIKYWYKIKDYNPRLIYQFRRNASNAIDSNSYYKIDLWNVNDIASRLLKSAIVNQDSLKTLRMILEQDYILKVKVNSVDSMQCYQYPQEGVDYNNKIYNINAKVIDTLKGKNFDICIPPQLQSFKENEIQSNNSNICFVYTTHFRDDNSHNFPIHQTIKSNNTLKLEIGDTLIVYLNFKNYYFDYDYDYFVLGLDYVQPIIDGNVYDTQSFWGNNESISYIEFKAVYQRFKNYLLLGGY